MRLELTLQRRVAIGFSLFFVIVIVAFSTTVLWVSEYQEEQLIDHLVGQEMDYLVDQYRVYPQVAPPKTQNLYGYIIDTDKVDTNLPRELRQLRAGAHEIFVDGVELHVAVREFSGSKFYLIYDVSQHEQRIRQFRLEIYLAIAISVILALWLSYWLSGQLTKPVHDLAQRVRRLHTDAGNQKLANSEQDAEVLLLAKALDGYRERVQTMIQHEKEFTADVSHELRTPLTAIRTNCEMVLQEAKLSESARARLQRSLLSVDNMTELIDSLLVLVRGAQKTITKNISVRECIEEVLDSAANQVQAKGLSTIVEAQQDLLITANKKDVMMLLSNLIQNAINHTRAGGITVTISGNSLCVTDTGVGIAQEHHQYLFERFYRVNADQDSSGHGLGLAIVKRIGEYYGWQITVTSEPRKGSTFCVRFS